MIPEKMDGIGWFTYEVIKRISSSHPEHEFVFIFDRKVSCKFKFPENVKVKVLAPQARLPFLWTIWFQFSLAYYLKRIKADFFLSPEGWIPLKLKIPTLAVIHDLNFEHHPENLIKSHKNYLLKYMPQFVAKADRIATVSEFSKKDIIDSYKVPAEKIDVVYNGVNEIFKPLNEEKKKAVRKRTSNGAEYFIFIGTLHPRKNLDNLFKAFEIFKSANKCPFKLVIVGQKKWWPTELEELYQSLKFKKDIIFTGRLSEEELHELLASAYALSYLPQFEGFGIPLLEAMKCEVPIITSNITAMPEVAGEAAIYCDPFNAEEIAAAMESIVNDSSLSEDLINIGRQRALNFSWDKTAELLWESIQKTINQ